MRSNCSLLIGCSLLFFIAACNPTPSAFKSSNGWANHVSFDAPTGTFGELFIGEPGQQSIEAKIIFTELATTGSWAPSAFVGFRSVDRKMQFKIFLTQNNQADKTLLAGYQLVTEGNAEVPKLLINGIPIYEPVLFHVNRDPDGGIRIRVAGSDVIAIGHTKADLLPFISVSSAKGDVAWTVR